jgi:hypothetical protein
MRLKLLKLKGKVHSNVVIDTETVTVERNKLLYVMKVDR